MRETALVEWLARGHEHLRAAAIVAGVALASCNAREPSSTAATAEGSAAPGSAGSAAASSAEAPASGAQLEVRVDRRIELLSIVHRLAGSPEYRRSPATAYVAAVDRAFAPFAKHPAVAATRELRARHSISFDAPMQLAVHLDDQLAVFGAGELAEIDSRWRGVDVEAYAAQLRAFAADSKLDAFLGAHRDDHRAVAAAVRPMIEAARPVAWFEGWFGARPDVRAIVAPALLAGPMNYGARASRDWDTELYQVLGVDAADGTITPDDATIELLVHEMAHSYVGPLLDRTDAFARAGETIHPLVAREMDAQHYVEWNTIVEESLVRALAVLYLREHRGAQVAANAARDDLRRGFLWINELAELLRRFQLDRTRNPTFEGYLPRIALMFDQLAAQYAHDGLPRTPFLGPASAVSMRELAVIAPVTRDAAVTRHVRANRDRMFAGAPLHTASEHSFTQTAGRGLVAYGTPASNPVIAAVAGRAKWTITDRGITLGKRTFAGEHLVLIACWFRSDDPTRGVVVYAAARDRDLLGIHDLPHGSTDWAVARRIGDGRFELVASGDFPRAHDGAWLPLE
ncbi:MAG: DUF4932 domain-containing protein [Kofleriaceae bacterium]